MSAGRPSGAIVRADELPFRSEAGCQVATAVGPGLGARIVRLDVVRVPSGARWSPPDAVGEENVVVVFEGSGTATSGPSRADVTQFTCTGGELGAPCA